jgi:hypothetical protein
VKTNHNYAGQRLGGENGAVRKALRLMLLFVIILLGAGGGPAEAQGKGEAPLPPGLGQLSVAEKWVLEKVSAGEVADLKEKFGAEEAPRQLRAHFLEALFTEGFPGFKVHRSGIYLVNAIIPDPLSLEFATVSHAVFLVGCRFQGPVNCGGCEFKKSLTLKQAVFAQPANFYRLKVGLDAFLGETVFQAGF